MYRYDVALLYLKQADYDLEYAIQAYQADENWEKNNPLNAHKGKAKARSSRFGIGGGLTGQLT